jgi:hypothetical protein
MIRIRNKNIKPRKKEILSIVDPVEIFQDINYELFKNNIKELELVKKELDDTININKTLQEDLKILDNENKTLELDLSNIKNQNNSYENQINNSISKIEEIEKELIILKKPVNSIIYNKKRNSLKQPINYNI